MQGFTTKNMKLDLIVLCFLMVSHNLAQHTTDQDQREKQGFSEDILYELNQNSKTLGVCLDRMNAMGEQMKLLQNNANMVEDKIEDGFKSLCNQIDSVEDKVDLMEDKMEDGFKSMGNQTSAVENKTDMMEGKMEKRFKSLENQTKSVEDKVDLMAENMEDGFKSLGNQTTSVEDKVDFLEDKMEDGFKSMGNQINAVEDKVDLMEDKMEDGFKSMGNQINAVEDTISGLCLGPSNCLDVSRSGITKSGIYTICPNNKPIQVYCDMETDGGGWLVFQRRVDGSENFYRGWNDYKDGFGNLTNEFWIGNKDLHLLLNTYGNQHELRVDLEDFNDETRFAKYSTFDIGNQADNYTLILDGYSGNAGDSLTYHNGKQFTTFDRDNDLWPKKSCAGLYRGAWWYGECCSSNLNGPYVNGPLTTPSNIGVTWGPWKGARYSLKFTEMKFRPK